MRSQKPYTNATFTRRVDHEAGRHRPSRAAAEPRVCGTCGAVYRRRRWVTARKAGLAVPDPAATPPEIVTCPACRRIAARMGHGYLYLSGAFLDGHRDEVMGLLRAEAERAAEDNPTGRIIAWERVPGQRLMITTTTEHLAERLGRALGRACDGDVRFDFSHENKLARVYWHRD